MKISIVAAIAENNAIGKDNKIPWHLPADFKLFKGLTSGNTIIMGLNTYRSIGKPLPNRHNIVLSPDPIAISGAHVCTSIPESLAKARELGKDVYICGGASVYGAFMGIADELCISHVKGTYEGDTFFPEIDSAIWQPVEEQDHGEFTFRRYMKGEG